MILGMSNTYQQLVTAPDVRDIKETLELYGDCRVGTNSPFGINHKTKGKLSSWLCWLLLIGTSLVSTLSSWRGNFWFQLSSIQ